MGTKDWLALGCAVLTKVVLQAMIGGCGVWVASTWDGSLWSTDNIGSSVLVVGVVLSLWCGLEYLLRPRLLEADQRAERFDAQCIGENDMLRQCDAALEANDATQEWTFQRHGLRGPVTVEKRR